MSTATVIAAVNFLKKFGIIDVKSYHKWIIDNPPDKIVNDELKTRHTRTTAAVNGRMAIARDFFENSQVSTEARAEILFQTQLEQMRQALHKKITRKLKNKRFRKRKHH